MKKLDEYPDYYITPLGDVYSMKRGKKRLIKGVPDDRGYLCVSLYNNGKRKRLKVHRLVGECYIDNPYNLPTVDHINRDKSNNNVDNLRWADYITQNNNQSRSGGRKYIITTPNNDEVVVSNLTHYCEKYDLNRNAMCGLATGKYNSKTNTYKGYSVRLVKG